MANKQSASNGFVRSMLTLVGEKRDAQYLGIEPSELQGKKIRATLVEEFNNMCVYCNERITGEADVDHLKPMNKDNVGLHMLGNLVLSCKPCNAAKHGSSVEDFLAKTSNPRAKQIISALQQRAKKYGADTDVDALIKLANEAYIEIGALLSQYVDRAEKLLSSEPSGIEKVRLSWTQKSGHDFSWVAKAYPIGSLVRANRDGFTGEVYGYSMEHQTNPRKAHVRIISESGLKRTRVNTDLKLI